MGLFLFPAKYTQADVPTGVYKLDVRGPLTAGLPVLPSCGRRATDFIASVKKLEIKYRSNVTINGEPWKVDLIANDKVEAFRDDLVKDLYVKVAFWRKNKTGALGILVVVGMSSDRAQCADAVSLGGTYR